MICAACAGIRDPECRLCEGRRYYQYEPHSGHYRSPSGLKIPAAAVPATASAPSGELAALLASIEGWAAKDARRRFKLWYEDGWNCYIWPNRYKPKLFEASDTDLVTCLSACWSKLKAASRRTKRPSTAT